MESNTFCIFIKKYYDNQMYFHIMYLFSVQKNSETKELSIISSVFKITASVSSAACFHVKGLATLY